MKYLLDTNICIYLIKRKPIEVFYRFKSHHIHEVSISVVTYFELQYGIEKSKIRVKSENGLQNFIKNLNIIVLDGEASARAASVRAHLEMKGTPIGAYDLLIAGTALAWNMVLVTNNTNEFERVPGLVLENWISTPW
jgi:tRNA(fMet)-specific endonuclease VapC